jgi:hypothetical protein
MRKMAEQTQPEFGQRNQTKKRQNEPNARRNSSLVFGLIACWEAWRHHAQLIGSRARTYERYGTRDLRHMEHCSEACEGSGRICQNERVPNGFTCPGKPACNTAPDCRNCLGRGR